MPIPGNTRKLRRSARRMVGIATLCPGIARRPIQPFFLCNMLMQPESLAGESSHLMAPATRKA